MTLFSNHSISSNLRHFSLKHLPSKSGIVASIKKSSIALAIITAVVFPTSVFAFDVNEAKEKEKSTFDERIQIIGHSDKLRKEAGSATLIGEAELEKFNFDDINRILYNVPGINIREEDGFGLRPNIGFRGATPERSKKITVMEDGILIGPAPYSAPAAYYFPMMSKMTSLEVFKGPSAIKYGPNTVVGALNMTTRSVPDDREGLFDVSLGSNGYSKSHIFYGNTLDGISNGNFGYLLEAVNMQSDGFKVLDGGGDTGFDKNDLMLKLRYDLTSKEFSQVFELKVAYADEKSNETYLGLTDQDFKANAYRRYAASQLDNMDWQHSQIQFTHFLEADKFDVTTRVYRNNFERQWFKVNGFKAGFITRDLQYILAEPEEETNALFYQVLTGTRDSEKEVEKIILGNNAREYYSQGIQSEIYWEHELAGLKHKFNVGVRYHQDQIERKHTEDVFLMQSANLISDGSEQVATTTNVEKTDALSIFMQDTINWQALDVTFGLRGEFLDSTYHNLKPGNENDWQKKTSRIWLPSMSVFYTLSEQAGILFGIHEGFIPTSPKEGLSVDIENSINYEFGARFNNQNTKVEAVVFYNDISNLKEGCTFSAASECGKSLDAEVNGGEVDVYGLEFSTSHTFNLNSSFDLPVSIVYTHTASEFKNSFESDFPMWGNIESGDELPYLPKNQLTLNVGLIADVWDLNLIARYVDTLAEASGTNVILEGMSTNAYTVVDLSFHYDIGASGRLYIKADNVFDKQEIASRRPYGARPGKPQQFFVGYQTNF
ncbi:MAG: TonB-dependent receptor [Alteromonadaceae bacterium]|nr:TonB-dependent receptor [Alteromonadaceae bacterium]